MGVFWDPVFCILDLTNHLFSLETFNEISIFILKFLFINFVENAKLYEQKTHTANVCRS